jgi:hypothetical protein
MVTGLSGYDLNDSISCHVYMRFSPVVDHFHLVVRTADMITQQQSFCISNCNAVRVIYLHRDRDIMDRVAPDIIPVYTSVGTSIVWLI